MIATASRPLPGSRQHNFYSSNRDTSVASLDSAFQLQEYLACLIQTDPHDIRRIVSLPKSLSTLDDNRGRDRYLGHEDEKDEGVDESCWIYEHLRRLAQDLNHPLITTLQQECSRETCPEMKAGEWLFLCVAHGSGPSVEKCCAIDYILHTLDSATALLNSPKAFPSRITIPPNSHRHFSSLARRLGRIFGHAYYQHREAFEQSEADTSLYSRFLALAAMYDLVPPDFLDIPHRESQGPTGETEDIEISRAPPDEFGGRNSSSPMGGRSRTDTMVRAEGFTLPAEEFEEHIPQPDLMESVELPASFYHEREDSPPLEHAVEPVPDLTEEPAELESEKEHEDSMHEGPEQDVIAHEAEPESLQLNAEAQQEESQQEESQQVSGEEGSEPEADDIKDPRDDPKEVDEEGTEEVRPGPEAGEPQETSAEPPVESDRVSVSMPAPAASTAEDEDVPTTSNVDREDVIPKEADLEVSHEAEAQASEGSEAPSAEPEKDLGGTEEQEA